MTHLRRPGRGARLSSRSRVTRRRPLHIEPLEDRALLATIAVAATPTIFDSASAAPHAEVPNVMAALAAQGHAAATFTDLSAGAVAAALADADVLLIPEQELAAITPALTAAAQDEIEAFVTGGGGLIVLGSPSGRSEAFLSGIFGLPLTPGPDPTAGVSFKDGVQSEGTTFASGPSHLFLSLTQLRAFDVSVPANIPPGTKIPYQNFSVAPTGLFPFGQGQIFYLGYDFDNPAGQSNAAGWVTVLGLAVEQLVPAPTPTASVELIGGDLVVTDVAGENDSLTLSADAATWTITMQAGLFWAPAAIPGVTVSDQSLVIDKAVPASFTGRFVFSTGGGNDVLRLTLDDLGRDVLFDGGESAGDNDRLEVSSIAPLATVTSAPDEIGGGTIDLGSDGSADFVYSGLEPVDLTGIVASELHLVIPAGRTDAELLNHLLAADGFSQLRFANGGVESQFFRNPTNLLAVHTAGSSLVTLLLPDSAVDIPQLLLDGAASDVFRMGSTDGIRPPTSVTLLGAALDLFGQSPTVDGLAGNGIIINSSVTGAVLTIGANGGSVAPGSPGDPTAVLVGADELWLPGASFEIQIEGTTPGVEYDQRQVSSLGLDGANLEVSLLGGFVPAPAQSWTIIDNTGSQSIVGTFAGLLEGASITVPGSSLPLFITYQGGDGNDVVLFTAADNSQVQGTGGDDTIILRRQGPGAANTELEYSLNGGPFLRLNDVDDLSIETGDGDDLIVLDFIFGQPVPPAGLLVDGGTDAAGTGDRLVLLGSGGDEIATYRPDAGLIELSGGGLGFIELAGLETIDVTALAEVALATDAGGAAIQILDAFDAGTGAQAALRVQGTSGEPMVPLHVWSVGKLTVDTSAGGGNDAVNINAAAGSHGIGQLHVNTGAGDDLLQVLGSATFAGPILLQSATIATEAALTSVAASVSLHAADHAIVRGPVTAGTTIELLIDVGNADLGVGGTLFVQAPLAAPGGVTALGNVDADRFEIEPQVAAALLILGDLPAADFPSSAGNARAGDQAGDLLVLDMTTAGGGQIVIGPVVVDTAGGRATAHNTAPVEYRGIEQLDLYDGGTLTSTQQGDLYLRTTDADEMVTVATDGASDPRVKLSVNGRVFPQGAYFGPLVRGRSLIVYARCGRDFVILGGVPLRGEFYGEAGDDYLAGAALGDLLVGGSGRDTILGGTPGGNDELWGDDYEPFPRDAEGQPIGAPTAEQMLVHRQFFSSRFAAGDGADNLSAASGHDQLYGQGGGDTIYGGGGQDYASGGGGDDQIAGGDGDDRLYGNGGHDTISGDGGHDLLSGGAGNDRLLGRAGNDLLLGGDGADWLYGHEGADALVAGSATTSAGTDAESTVAVDGADAALVAALVTWSQLGSLAGIASQLDDGDLDVLLGDAGGDRFAGDGTDWYYDFVAGQDAAGL